MMAAILFSRFLTLTHEMSFHLDEPNIYRSSVSLAEKVLHPEQVYQVALVYPEGSYVMQMPFHLLSRIVGSEWGDRVWARIASVCYYSAGCLTGALCLYRFMGRRRGSVVFFGMLCVFSLFYVEQSRYGTGDPPSFFLLMVLLFACGQFIQTKRNRWLCLAGLCVGALGAVKYPQIYFLLLPAPLAFSKERKWGGMLHFLMLLGCMLAGFLMLSPSLLVWPEYLVESIRRETDAYMRSWSGFTPLENLLELLIYHLLYAEFPLAPVLMLCAAVSGRKAGGKQTKERLDFWKCWVPLVTFIFVVYNLFVGLLVFRTLNRCGDALQRMGTGFSLAKKRMEACAGSALWFNDHPVQRAAVIHDGAGSIRGTSRTYAAERLLGGTKKYRGSWEYRRLLPGTCTLFAHGSTDMVCVSGSGVG